MVVQRGAHDGRNQPHERNRIDQEGNAVNSAADCGEAALNFFEQPADFAEALTVGFHVIPALRGFYILCLCPVCEALSKSHKNKSRNHPHLARRDFLAPKPASPSTALPNNGRAAGSGTAERPRHLRGKRRSGLAGKSPRGLR